MKHVAFFLSVVVAGIIIAAGAYVYSSSATWNGYGTGEGLPFEWFKQAMTFAGPGEAQTSHEKIIHPQRSELKNSLFDLGDLYRGVEEEYFYPKLYASNGAVLTQHAADHEYVIDHALGRLSRGDRHLVGSDSAGSFGNRPWARGLDSDRYYRRAPVASGSSASLGGAGTSRGSQGDSSSEGLPVVAQLFSLPEEYEDLPPSVLEEKIDEDEVFSEPVVEEKLASAEEGTQPVPEPATWLTVVAGLFLILLNRTKRSVVK